MLYSRKQYGGSSSSGVQVAPQLDEKVQAVDTPHYVFSRLLPLSGGQSQTVGSGAQQEVLFELPSTNVINLAHSYLSYQMAIPAQGASTYIHVPMDTFGEISQIQLMPRGGAPIADILYANNYLKMIRKPYTAKVEFDEMVEEDGLYQSNLPAAQNPSATPAIYQAAGAAGGVPVNASINFKEPQYIKTSQAANAVWPVAAGTQLRQVKLGYFKGTVLALDKDEYFPQTMVLRIVFSGSKVGWSGTSNVNPATGSAPLTGNITLSQLQLYLAAETREDIIKLRMAESQRGKEISVPFIWYARVNLTGASQAVQVRMTGSNGSFCRRILIAPFAPNETNNYIFDHSNVTGAAGTVTTGGKLLSYYTTIDGKRQQQYDIGCVPPNSAGVSVAYPGDDYLLNKKFLSGSVIQSKEMYKLNWLHIEDFVEGMGGALGPGGLELGKDERQYYFYAQTICSDSAAATMAINWYVFYETTRKLKISSNLVQIE